ncbi:helix-turn-helix domain-containing protein [Hymenobacter mucosus]|uniref:Regulatory protein, arsR family n=1 Tax=Hymenobacter mucosus TaxID=1411120 RepID=A0A238VLA0_9BACT|nr:helix-turn-helix domain-containing protein [Hymenobacter mucosus]SNR34269.1 regulatory protein, arsR family [Hymenobacter mucosus]
MSLSQQLLTASNPTVLARENQPATLPLLNTASFLPSVTDPEFDILDELYFVTSFPDLARKTGLTPPELERHLRSLLEQGLVRSYWPDPDTELAFEESSFGAIVRDCFFLASKEGLLQHNTR